MIICFNRFSSNQKGNFFWKKNTKQVSQGFRPPPPPIISPLLGQIPRDLVPPGPNPKGFRPPCAPPFRDLAPPPLPSQRYSSETILVFRPGYQESFWNMVWRFIWQCICASQTQSQCCLTFSKSRSWLPSQYIRDYSFAAAILILLCLFYIANIIDCLVGDTSLRLIYIH